MKSEPGVIAASDDAVTTARRGLAYVADDDAEMRALISTVLRADGFEVREAGDGADLMGQLREAFSAVDGARPDLIVTDDQMPGTTGMRVLRWLRGEDFKAPVVVITAFGSPQFHSAALNLGAAAVLDKPFDLAEFQAIVSKLVAAPGDSTT